MALAIVCVLWASMALAQPVEVDALRVFLGATGATCTLHAGSGAPASGLGAVCDVYVRTDSTYGIYVKDGASTWREVYRANGTDVAVADGGTGLSSWTTGQLVAASSSTTLTGITAVASNRVLASAGVGTLPVYTADPIVTTLTGQTNVSTPIVTNSGNLTLSPSGDVRFDPTGNDLLPVVGYDLNIGALTNKFLTLHAAELWVETLVAQDTLATIGGRVLVGPTTTLTADLASGGTSIQVKHNQIANGDRLVLQANGSLEWLAVTSGASGSAGAYTYSVTRNLDGSGANDWVAGDAVFNTGTTNDGFIDLYSVNGIVPGSTAGPTIVGNVRTGTTYSNIEPRWAIGNLNGLYGYGADTYGVALGSPSAAWVKIDPTNGVRIGHNSTTKIQLDASGDASFAEGDVTIDSAGIRLTPDPAGYTQSRAFAWAVTGSGAQLGLGGFQTASATSIIGTAIGPSGDTGNIVLQATSVGGPTGASLTLTGAASGGTSEANITAAEFTFTGANFVSLPDLNIYGNNGSTTAKPYIRSDGNYLVIESRSGANGGAIYLGNDTLATVDIGGGGGAVNVGHGGAVTIATSGSSTSIYNASMHTSLTLNGLASCTLAVNGSGAVGCVSDGAAKTAITPWAGGLDVVAKLKPVSYRWKEGDSDRHIGFIAQDVEDVIPDAVRRQRWGGDLLTLDDRAILAALVNAVQELQRRVR
ncbi:MAG: tail fiber domain-containing protein [Vicinamibacterales bacterium]